MFLSSYFPDGIINERCRIIFIFFIFLAICLFVPTPVVWRSISILSLLIWLFYLFWHNFPQTAMGKYWIEIGKNKLPIRSSDEWMNMNTAFGGITALTYKVLSRFQLPLLLYRGSWTFLLSPWANTLWKSLFGPLIQSDICLWQLLQVYETCRFGVRWHTFKAVVSNFWPVGQFQHTKVSLTNVARD